MGILDDLKHKAEQLGDRAKEGFDAAKDKAGDLIDDAKDRVGHSDESPLSESSDIGPDSASTDAEQPGYITAEDDDSDLESEETDSDDIDDDDADSDAEDVSIAEEELLVSEPAPASDVVPPAAAELDPVDLDAAELDAETSTDEGVEAAAEPDVEPAVETDVDPYDQPLTETIGDEIAASLVDQEAVAEAVDSSSSERES